MFDYQVITVSRYDGNRGATVSRYYGDRGTTRAIEVFDCVTGRTVGITRSRPYETKQAWIDRAFASAAQACGVDASAVIGTAIAQHQPIAFTIDEGN